MIATAIGSAVASIFPKLFDGYLDYKAKVADSETERRRIAANKDIHLADTQAKIIVASMAFKIFWVAWGIAAIPAAAWFGWGMLDSTVYDGAVLPDVAALPPQLKEYFDTVWNSLFISGVGGATAQTGLRVYAATRGAR